MSNKNHVHVWEWNVPPEALDCMKCGEYLDCGNIVEHMNALESQLASRDALIERLGSKLEEAYFALTWNAVLKTEEDAAEFKVLIAEWEVMKGEKK